MMHVLASIRSSKPGMSDIVLYTKIFETQETPPIDKTKQNKNQANH